ncbi:MAG: primosomal protein N' [Desulfobacterota bacterium]|nr:primosomal protein N' [Thermodesulfobacteriota bacterium]
MNRLLEVAVPLPLTSVFTYRIPEALGERVATGTRVLVPFGRRIITGYVLGEASSTPDAEIKDIIDILDPEPLFSSADLQFYRWISQYYCHPLGLTIKTALPPGLTVTYEDRAALTPEGNQARTDPQTEPRLRQFLELLHARGPRTLKSLRTHLGVQGFSNTLNALCRAGFVRILRSPGRSIRIKTERWFSATGAQPERRLTERQRAVLACITEHGRVSERMLRERFGQCSHVCSVLEQSGLITAQKCETFRLSPEQELCCIEAEHVLNDEQRAALALLEPALDGQRFYPLLLHGITGSGKTEVYLQVMQRVIDRGSQCLYLVPEIALTAQLYDRISSRLKVPVVMLHSGLSDGERFDAWRMIRAGTMKVVIGARSALFAPCKDLGAIIVDEEHDSSYKQEDGLRYHARDMAVVRAKMASCVVVLGSATPSLESFANAESRKYAYATLTRRIENRPLPRVQIVPLNAKSSRSKPVPILSDPLREALALHLAKGRQSILFLNRRGFAPVYVCQTCGAALRCPNCAVSLIYHRAEKHLRCHYCGFIRGLTGECPACGSYFLTWLGWGTERLEAELATLFPTARIARMDRDTTSRRGTVRTIVNAMSRGAIDILIGTQMLVKGYHLPQVTLVGVVCADQSLHFPDYRASERTFQLLTQVAGRAGRGEIAGEVIIQTYTPDHYSIRCAQHHDYHAFYTQEMKTRRDLGYPPYTKMIILRCEGTNRAQVSTGAQTLGEIARQLDPARTGIEVLGPCPAPIERIRNRWRYHMLLKARSSQRVRTFAQTIVDRAQRCMQKTGVSISLDVDPVQVL